MQLRRTTTEKLCKLHFDTSHVSVLTIMWGSEDVDSLSPHLFWLFCMGLMSVLCLLVTLVVSTGRTHNLGPSFRDHPSTVY